MEMTKFSHDEIVKHRVSGERGIIVGITFHDEHFYVYNVNFESGFDTCREGELEISEYE